MSRKSTLKTLLPFPPSSRYLPTLTIHCPRVLCFSSYKHPKIKSDTKRASDYQRIPTPYHLELWSSRKATHTKGSPYFHGPSRCVYTQGNASWEAHSELGKGCGWQRRTECMGSVGSEISGIHIVKKKAAFCRPNPSISYYQPKTTSATLDPLIVVRYYVICR
eukprot:1377293-Amorphochlora_amoeboformis.AAC.2